MHKCNRFHARTKAALRKDGFAFAIENVIAGVGQSQNAAEQVRLDLRAVDPKSRRRKHQKKFSESDKGRQRNSAQIIAGTQVGSRQVRRKSKQDSANKYECERIERKVILPHQNLPEAAQR